MYFLHLAGDLLAIISFEHQVAELIDILDCGMYWLIVEDVLFAFAKVEQLVEVVLVGGLDIVQEVLIL